MPAPVFRLGYEVKGTKYYVAGSTSVSSHKGEIRAVSGMGYIHGAESEFKIFA